VYFERVVPVIGGLLSDRDAYAYLPKSMAYLPSAEEMLAMLRRAGFPSARRLQLSGGITQLLTGVRA
jgi:demethylmenaquinone methyltransferase/2-methoxy-6-polyprenyl-1,4-benzoquinol methylase